MAISAVENAIKRGLVLQNKSVIIYSGKDDDGKTFYHTLHKIFKDTKGNEECKTEYEGHSSEEAAKKLIEIIGMFDAMVLVREHIKNAQQ